MRYHEPVHKALKAADDLTALIQADFDTTRGGCAWWHDYGLDIDAVTGIMDYLYGLVLGVGENLRIGAIHLYDLRECRFSDDRWTIAQFKNGAGRSKSLIRGDQEARREARIDAHTAGVLRAAGSTLDNLAGIIIAVGGFDMELVKADLGKLLPLTDGADYPGPDVRGQLKLQKKVLDPTDKQGTLLRAARSSLHHAGPEGWLDWTRWSRNDRVHRGARIAVNYIQKDKIARPLPRQPDYPEAHAYRTASDPRKLFLEEDSLDTLAGIVDSLNSAVVGTFVACEQLWAYRRDHPDQIVQPSGQWPNKPPRDVTFNGYRPGSATLPKDSVALVSPATGTRFQASRVLDGQNPTR
ncbi:hypothetical protein GCM10027598_31310 [Amycolatopsis oliviviridis]|uniref:Uncharacterized protein n=1 Tax=Amycolatopsis oliviviridis TaxID=1471590 RepID=A0ABQ3LRU0_9PSEU|nr:hypothetical protein [Amycolatopsis oliviviridis]GHH24475.1 hypothetical protein GCM10017790_48850 [Amycolatopsis oliviviridis]